MAEALSAALGRGPARAEDDALAGSSNPFCPLPSVARALQRAIRQIDKYPDPTCAELIAEIADRLAVPREEIVVGPGSLSLVLNLVRALAGGTTGGGVRYSGQPWGSYAALCRAAGVSPITVPLSPTHEHDLPALVADGEPRVILIDSPHNPSGTVVSQQDMVRFLDGLSADVTVVFDEAYGDFVRDPRAADGLALKRRYPNVVVLRSFSIAHGLADLRVGYAVARPPLAEAMHRCLGYPAVSNLAQRAAIASLRAEEELRARVAWIVAERQQLHRELTALGLNPPPSEANFLWLPPSPHGMEFALHCWHAGLRVKLHSDDSVRVTVGRADVNLKLLLVASGMTFDPPGRPARIPVPRRPPTRS
jgi:histidinol-phosphate aminotransferase